MRASPWASRAAVLALVLGLLPLPPDGAPAVHAAAHSRPHRVPVVLPLRSPDPQAGPLDLDPLDELVLAQLELDAAARSYAPILKQRPFRADRPDPSDLASSRTVLFERTDVGTSDDLRRLAADLRASPALGEGSRPHRLAARLVRTLYPALPETLDPDLIAPLLESYATRDDLRALESFYRWARRLESDGTFRPGSITPGGNDPVVRDPLDLPEPGSVLNLRVFPAPGRFEVPHKDLQRYEALRAAARAQLEVAARVAISDFAAAPSPYGVDPPALSELLASWEPLTRRRQRAVLTAISRIGRPYRFARRGPDAFDCSGFTAYAWSLSGVRLPTYSLDQLQRAEPVHLDDLRPADLAVWRRDFSPRTGRYVGHVALWLGVGRFYIDAADRTGRVKVKWLDEYPTAGFGRIDLVEEDALLED